MTCSFCDYIGAGLLAIPMAASELTSPRWRSGEWVASKVVRRIPAVILPCYLKTAHHFARSRSEIEVRGKIRPGSRRGKAFADLDPVWGKGNIDSDQFVQIGYLNALSRYANQFAKKEQQNE